MFSEILSCSLSESFSELFDFSEISFSEVDLSEISHEDERYRIVVAIMRNELCRCEFKILEPESNRMWAPLSESARMVFRNRQN